ncbi:MAG: HD domain-containing protein [Methanoregulaceae archaeon]|nr:HD domain-containing protein [Methanoregulaceae archaeon]
MTHHDLDTWRDRLEQHAPGEAGHSDRVSVYAVATADRLMNGPDFPGRDSLADLRRVRITAALHDIGKLRLPSELFAPDRAWSASDVRLIREHVLVPDELADPELDHEAIRQHHERLDGLGYPDGLRGLDIVPLARVIAVCEAFDAMVFEARYRKPKSEEAAIEELRRGAGTQFCPSVIEAFVAVQPLIQPLVL